MACYPWCNVKLQLLIHNMYLTPANSLYVATATAWKETGEFCLLLTISIYYYCYCYYRVSGLQDTLLFSPKQLIKLPSLILSSKQQREWLAQYYPQNFHGRIGILDSNSGIPNFFSTVEAFGILKFGLSLKMASMGGTVKHHTPHFAKEWQKENKNKRIKVQGMRKREIWEWEMWKKNIGE